MKKWPLILLICAIAFGFWASALSFVPLPWPDDSAFFLPGINWLRWPFDYRMHAQAPFVPTYDIANFNTMPLLPLLLGLGNWVGISTSHAIRLFGTGAFALWVILLVLWMDRRKVDRRWIWTIALAALFSPAIRWGAMVVRTEIWVGLFWTLILMDLDGFFKKPNPWRIPAFLALAAYFHFEAIVWVLPTTLAILLSGPFRSSFKRLLGVGIRTALLLTPWILYVLLNWKVFWIQMDTQFGRLHTFHPYVRDWYGLFHSLFLSGGSPTSLPKFFNLGKIITWCLMIIVMVRLVILTTKKKDRRGIFVAALTAVFATFYLWLTKPETWFTALIHLALWPALILSLKPRTPKMSFKAKGAVAAIGLLIILEGAVAGQQWLELKDRVSWKHYQSWVDCIDNTIGPRNKIWQPHWPDVLVELAGRKPSRDYTRAVDFDNIDSLIRNHAWSSEAIIHSIYINWQKDDELVTYQGTPRAFDTDILRNYHWIPFREYSAVFMGKSWEMKICQEGPFWAAISVRPEVP